MKNHVFLFMFYLTGCFTLTCLFSPNAFAQFSVQETDGKQKIRFLNTTWNTNFFSLASTEQDILEEGGARVSTYNFFTFATYLPNDLRFAVRVPFQYSTPGQDRFNGERLNDSEFFMHDLILTFQDFNLMYLPWDVGVFWEGRIYLPTSSQSHRQGQIARLRNNFIFSKVLTRVFETEIDHRFNYFIQSRTAFENNFIDSEGFPVSTMSNTRNFGMQNTFRLWAKVTPQTGIGWQVGHEDTYFHESDFFDRTRLPRRVLRIGPQVRFPISDAINFIVSYQDEVDRDRNKSEFGQFLARNASFQVLSFVRF